MLRTARLSGAALVAAILLPGAPALGATHLVTPGETLSGIAAANGLSTSAVAAANGMSPTAFAISGTRLTIPAPGSVATAPAAAPRPPSTAPARAPRAPPAAAHCRRLSGAVGRLPDAGRSP